MKSRVGRLGKPDRDAEKNKAKKDRVNTTNQTLGASEGLSDAQGWHPGMGGAALRRGSGHPEAKGPRQ